MTPLLQSLRLQIYVVFDFECRQLKDVYDVKDVQMLHRLTYNYVHKDFLNARETIVRGDNRNGRQS